MLGGLLDGVDVGVVDVGVVFMLWCLRIVVESGWCLQWNVLAWEQSKGSVLEHNGC